MRSFSEFKALFDDDLLPSLEDLKKELSWRNIFQFGIIIVLGAILFILFVLIAMELIAVWVVILISIFLIAGAIWQVRKLADRRDIEVRYKKVVNSKLIEFVAPRGEYHSEGFVPYKDFLASELFQREPDYYGGDDLLITNQDGVEVKFSEVKAAWEEVGEDIKGNDSSEWHIIFNGIFMVSSLNKNYSDMVIIPDASKGSFGQLGYETKKANEQYGEFVDVQHPEFSNYFTAYAKDAKKAKSMISEDFMDNAVRIAQSIEEPIFFSFKGQKMYVAIHYDKPMFEFNAYLANITNPEKPYEVFKEMEFLVNIGASLNTMKRRIPTVETNDFEEMENMQNMGTLGSSSQDLELTDEEIEAIMRGE